MPLWPDPRVALLKELADPVRLRVIDRLGVQGTATVSELATAMDVPLPLLSNHLRRLRDAGMVRVQRSGRHALYELTDPGLQALLPLLDRLTGRLSTTPAPSSTPFASSRSCYDHLAGRLGVGIYAALRERNALRDQPDGTVALGAAADRVLGALGIDPGTLDAGRRRFAYECFDATEHAPHLGGAVGDAIAHSLAARDWIARESGSRIVRVTPRGRRGLERTLGLTGG